MIKPQVGDKFRNKRNNLFVVTEVWSYDPEHWENVRLTSEFPWYITIQLIGHRGAYQLHFVKPSPRGHCLLVQCGANGTNITNDALVPVGQPSFL